jgi:DnaD and phage-associated domain
VNGCVDENLKKIVNIYEQNIGKIYPADRQWFIDVSEEFPWNLFEEGIKTCIDRGHVTPGYLKGIVQNWRTRGITTVSEFKADKVEHENRGRSFNYEPRGTNSHGVGVISARNSHQVVTAEQLAQMAKRESMMELD